MYPLKGSNQKKPGEQAVTAGRGVLDGMRHVARHGYRVVVLGMGTVWVQWVQWGMGTGTGNGTGIGLN